MIKASQAEAQGQDLRNVLNEEEKAVFNLFQVLNQAYTRGVALRVSQQGYFADVNDTIKEISEKYARSRQPSR